MIQRFATAMVVTAVGLALFCSTALAVGTDAYEPNDSAATAVGPLVGGQLYQGSINSTLDRDYFYFYTAGSGSYNVSIVDYGDPWNICRKDWVALTASGDLLDYQTSWGSNDIYGGNGGSSSVLAFAATSASKVYIRVAGEPNPYCWDSPSYYHPGPDKYTIRVLPAEAVASSLPAPPAPPAPSEKCIAAKTVVGKDAASIKKLKKSIAKSSGKTARRLRAKLRKVKSDMSSAEKRVKKYC